MPLILSCIVLIKKPTLKHRESTSLFLAALLASSLALRRLHPNRTKVKGQISHFRIFWAWAPRACWTPAEAGRLLQQLASVYSRHSVPESFSSSKNNSWHWFSSCQHRLQDLIILCSRWRPCIGLNSAILAVCELCLLLYWLLQMLVTHRKLIHWFVFLDVCIFRI